MFEYIMLLPLLISVIGLAYGGWSAAWVLRQDPGTDKMKEISGLIAEGARAFLAREYRTIFPVGVILAILVGVAYYLGFHSGVMAALAIVSFALGALGSGLAGYIGMYITTRSASRTAQAARKEGLGGALRVSYRAGSVMGTMLASIALLIISILFLAYQVIPQWGEALIPAAFGASLMSLFIRVAGGIFTKAADWGADIVGKVEAGIPEDDPRNPGTIADNVGDNVGDVAGMASDVYESLVVVLTGAMFLAAVFRLPVGFAEFPLLAGASALIGALLGMQVVRGRAEGAEGAMGKLNASLYVATAVTVILVAIISVLLFGATVKSAAIVISDFLGMVTAIAVLHITEYYTHYTHAPVKNIAKQSTISASNVIVAGYSYGLSSAVPVLIVVALVLGASFALGYYVVGVPTPIMAGIYGTAAASVGLLSMAGIVITLDSFGPVSDNASGLAEMADLPPEVRDATDTLDAIGNTTKATTKGYAIASAGLAALVLFIGFVYEVVERIVPPGSAPSYIIEQAFSKTSVMEPDLLIGAFLGAVLVYLFSSRTLMSVSRTAMELVEEIRRQFREIPGILEGKSKPDYSRAVDIVTRHALGEFMLPGLLAVALPILIGLLIGWVALVGLILGTIIIGFPRALLMANAGGAWDNAKKYIEANRDPSLGGKGSPAHKNAVVGDVVGDPFKDTTGPSLNPLIKVVNTVSVVFAAAIVAVDKVLGTAGGLFPAGMVLTAFFSILHSLLALLSAI
ncbi:sodium-translocating pyrophosphatase [Conexivisphaera calida]|uniref:K(+)-insensitive pyrophosphate-energized proton pump n=1 Tax=Conexivisphaera calida TaxID=1874277 RepID=A0A4P2VAF6_9ARCH|nr:sodium-translocating pyrophosphatase [Conexivisphaera calida]BBE41459.1 Pyrophosphate-energized proton pump [Conexivisphaera calida]